MFLLAPWRLVFVVLLAAGAVWPAAAAWEVRQGTTAGERAELTREEMARFLRTARIIGSTPIGTGVTRPWRLTLTDGRLTHDAAFQSVDERQRLKRFPSGRVETEFVDSYHYNIAAYRLAELIGLADMMPVTVERSWNRRRGALSWWLADARDEAARIRLQLAPPDGEEWERQMHRMRVFSALVHDTDRNLGNLLFTPDWKLWMIDFTRAFRRWERLLDPAGLRRCDRTLLEQLRALTAEAVRAGTRGHLNAGEIRGLMARRDLLVAHFEALIAEKGEEAVLY